MEYLVKNKNGNETTVLLNNTIFDLKYNEKMIHQIITSYTSNIHIGIKKHKSRSEVSGGGKKPWRQKGTGRARAGTIRSPIWKGGGKTFAAKALKQKEKKINKKTYKTGMKVIISQLIRDKRISIIDEIESNSNKTKMLLHEISYLNNIENSIFILENVNEHINLASRNFKNIIILSYKKINPLVLLKFKKIFITISGIKALEEYLK
ncbi:MAG TPA: 50S ribosomal protein L4 [Candidatus Azoamicus sp. MARI]